MMKRVVAAVVGLAGLVAACGGDTNDMKPVGMEGVGTCVWDRMAAPLQENLTKTLKDQGQDAFIDALRPMAQPIMEQAKACDPAVEGNMTGAGFIAMASILREAEARIIAQDMGISRVHLDQAMAKAPKALRDAEMAAELAYFRGQPAQHDADMGPVLTDLGLPSTDEFLDSERGQRVVTYYRADFRVKAAARALKEGEKVGAH